MIMTSLRHLLWALSSFISTQPSRAFYLEKGVAEANVASRTSLLGDGHTSGPSDNGEAVSPFERRLPGHKVWVDPLPHDLALFRSREPFLKRTGLTVLERFLEPLLVELSPESSDI